MQSQITHQPKTIEQHETEDPVQMKSVHTLPQREFLQIFDIDEDDEQEHIQVLPQRNPFQIKDVNASEVAMKTVQFNPADFLLVEDM